MHRLYAHGLIAKIPRTCPWHLTRHYGHNFMGTTIYLRVRHFPNVYAGLMH